MKSRADEFGHECMQAILAAKREVEDAGSKFMASSIAVIVAEKFKQYTKRENNPISKMTDEEFIEFLESAEHLRGVDIQREIGKCQFWCKVNRKEATRMRIINWLNKAERTVSFDGTGKSSVKPKESRGIPEPAGWQQWVRDNSTDPSHADRQWASMPIENQRYIYEQVTKQK